MSKQQTGHIWRVKKSWYGRWYRDEIEDGVLVRSQHAEKLCDYSDRYRSKKDVKPLLAEKLAPVNEGRCSAESTLTIVKYVEEFYFPYAETELKPSTVHGYRGIWRMYLKPRLGNIVLRDFTCGQATKLLTAIHGEHKLSKKSLRHCKGLLQTIFTHAKRTDVLASDNPIQGAGLPRAAVAADKTPAYATDEVMAMLHALNGPARTAVALMFFAGLRPGEARGMKWSDYDKNILHVRRSIWRKHSTGPKTEASLADVPVAEALREILSEVPRSSDFILATPSGLPVDLHNLAARVIVPGLKRCTVCRKLESDHAKADHKFELDKSLPEWRGFYALRRGLATTLADVDTALAAKSVLRHSNIATTTAHYIKSLDPAAVRAIDKVSLLFDNASGRPN